MKEWTFKSSTKMKLKLIWWFIFLGASAPAVFFAGLYFFNPRALGVDPVEVLLQDSGEWAMRLLLVTLACSPLRRIGWKGAVRYRRMLGLFSFFYASIHLSIYIAGWIEWEWAIFVEDLAKRPFIYLGMIAWFTLFLLALTSPKAMVKLLRKRWVILHRLVYVSIALVWVHFWMQSRSSAGEALIYGLIALLLLCERVFRKIQKGRPTARSA